MFRTLLRAIVFWLVFFETLAAQRGWRGLSVGRWPFSPRMLLPLPLLAFMRITGSAIGRVGALALAAPVALVIQSGLSSLLNRTLDPRLRLRPGTHAHYRVEAVAITLDGGQMPALHVVPHADTCQAVCVLHGSGCEKTYYAWPLVDTLIAEGYAVLLVDLDGHGENTRPQRFPDIIDNPVAAVKWLRERYSSVGLIGISLGGCIAAHAVANGLVVEQVAVLEAPPHLHFDRTDMVREGFGLLRFELLELFSESTAAVLIESWQAPPIRAEISTWDLIDRLDLLGSLQKIKQPLLLLYGGSDAIVKPTQAREVAAIVNPSSRFRLLKGVSHLALQVSPSALREIGAWFRN